jgi:alpha-tubulin suppressor-like RCC1 family protein
VSGSGGAFSSGGASGSGGAGGNVPVMNQCGGVTTLTQKVGDACGDCGAFVCNGKEALSCNDLGKNACGGCNALTGKLGDACGGCGALACNGQNALQCVDPGYAKPTALVAGALHTCALMSTGTVRCWGDNSLGQLGLAASTTSAALVPAVQGIKQLAAGDSHTCALTSSGSVECWGDNSLGQLGDGTTTGRSTPAFIKNFTSVTGIFAGGLETCLLDVNGVYCAGGDRWNQLGDLTPPPCQAASSCFKSTPIYVSNSVISMGINSDFACIAGSDNGLRCWGDFEWGQTAGNSSYSIPWTNQAMGVASVAISDGTGMMGHACALTTTGGVRCWGACVYGECGPSVGLLGELHSYPTTDIVTGAASIAPARNTVCARLTNGKVDCWGGGSNAVSEVSGITGATALAAGTQHFCAIVGTSVLCWGNNNGGQLGNGSTSATPSTTPGTVKGLSNVCQ